jgi:hypothetical protein
MTTTQSLWNLACCICFLGAMILVIGSILYWLDAWLWEAADEERIQHEVNT